MATRTASRANRERAMLDVIAAIDLPEARKSYLRARWLEQMVWLGGRARSCRDWYYGLRLTTIIGGLIVPALIGLNFSDRVATEVASGAAFVLGLVVAIAAAVEEFFHYGDRWRHYRRAAEQLKREGWQFFQLAGPYQGFATLADGYATFAGRTEELLGQDVEVYIDEVARERTEASDGESTVGQPAPAATGEA